MHVNDSAGYLSSSGWQRQALMLIQSAWVL